MVFKIKTLQLRASRFSSNGMAGGFYMGADETPFSFSWKAD